MIRNMGFSSLILLVMVAFSTVGFLEAPRDGSFTTDMRSFEPATIVQERLWEEHPVQIINTFFVEGTSFLGLGGQDSTSIELAERLELKYGSQYVDTVSGYGDIEEITIRADDEAIEYFRTFLDRGGYYHRMECPHDTGVLCRVGVAWNREFTRAENVTLIFLRTAEDEYTFVDGSLFTVGE